MKPSKLVVRLLSALALVSTSALADTTDWPTQPIRLIVPFAAGGSVDVTARGLSQLLSEELNQSVVVENRAGGGGRIGVDAVVKAQPDGYTVVLASAGTIAIAPHIYSDLPYDPLKDLAPITPVVNSVNVMVVPASSPVESASEFIEHAKKQPGKLNFGSSGVGASDHMATELFTNMTGIQLVNIPYRGGGPAMIDLLAGRVDVMFSAMAPAISNIHAGKLRALGVTSAERLEILPDVPTIAEVAVPSYESVAWYGLFAPAGTPDPIVEKLSEATAKALKDEGLRTRLVQSGLVPFTSTPAEFKRFVEEDTDKYGKLVKENGITAE